MQSGPSAIRLLLIVIVAVVPIAVVAEEFFQMRNRNDNTQYRIMEDKNVVTSMEKAEEILKRYGYLRCGSSRRRSVSRYKEGGRPGGRRCSGDEIRQAIRRYQNTYNMPPTGKLDQVTLKVMSESRCGNPDNENRAVRFKPMINPRKRHWRKSHHAQILGRHKRDASSIYDSSTELDSNVPLSEMYQSARTTTKAIPLHELVIGGRTQADEGSFPSGTSMSRRRRFLEQYMKDLESGDLDKKLEAVHEKNQKRRRKRSPSSGVEGHAFANEVVTWRLIGSAYSNQLTVNSQRAALSLAFRMWGEVIPLVFQEDVRSSVDDVDVLIAFGRGEHLNCPNHFDGFGGQLSHAIKMSAANAEIHVDDDEYLTVGSNQGTNLVKVAVHEVGHALGMFHTSRNYSIMYAIYSQVIPNNNFELGWEDRKLVQDIYGTCKVRFNTMFDWVRRRPDGQLIYNTYFFRDNRYWMYENRYNRTRYGDPLHILPEWKGIPVKVDGYSHVWTYTKDAAYFFKGHHFWLYNSADDEVAPGYPKNISSEFRAKPGSGYPSIPGHLDSVFFDKRDGNLYFFKGSLVYAYDVSRDNEGCCLPGYPKHLHDEFPSVNKDSSLPPHLDAVYYSYTDRSMYFLKGIHFWHNVAFNPLDRRRSNKIKGPRLISSKWFDICDLEA